MAEGTNGNGTSRGEFLARGAGAAGIAIGAGVWAAGAAGQTATADVEAAAATTARTSSAARYALELDGILIGLLNAVDGGAISADVIQEKQIDYFARKHIGSPKYEDFSAQFGWSMSKTLYEWINASWTGQAQRKNGAIVAADFQYEEKSRRSFTNALITETTIPALDASSKDTAYLTLKFSPEITRTGSGSGKLSIPATKQKQWLASNFRLEIDGLDCTKVTKIDAFTIKQSVVTDQIGEERDFEREPGKLEFPNLKITLAESGAQTWLTFFDDFVIKGNNGQASEKSGKLTFLDPTLKTALGEITFFNLGIYRLADAKQEANDSIKRLTAELYCERMEIRPAP